jgi:hypothetical protein
MDLFEDLLSDQHIAELIREAGKEVRRRGMHGTIDPADVVSRMTFPPREVRDDDILADPLWTDFLNRKCLARKPVEQPWHAFVMELVREVAESIRTMEPAANIKPADIVEPLLYRLKDGHGNRITPGLDFAKCRLIARKPLDKPWSLFLSQEMHNAFRSLFRTAIAEKREFDPLELDTDAADEDDSFSLVDRINRPPEDLATDDFRARYTKVANWKIDELIENGFITAGPQADHFREVLLTFMNSDRRETLRDIAKEFAGTLDKEMKRAFQKNFKRWRDEVVGYLTDQYNAEKRAVQTGTRP